MTDRPAGGAAAAPLHDLRRTAENVGDINRYRVRFLGADRKYLIRKHVLRHLFRLASLAAWAVAPLLPAAWKRIDRPVFIVGCSRSGTTLFQDLFADHPDFANWSEAGQLFELDYFNPDIDHVKDEAHATPFERARLGVIVAAFLRLTGRTRFLNKHPQNALRIRLLKAVFPDARFVHLVRDGRAVIWSNLAQVRRDRYRGAIPFGSFPKPPAWRAYMTLPEIDRYAHQWADIVAYVRGCVGSAVAENDYMEVRFEEFCAQPAATLRRLDEFCGIDPDRRPAAALPSRIDPRNDKWRRGIAAEDMDRIRPIIAPMMRELRYPVEDAV